MDKNCLRELIIEIHASNINKSPVVLPRNLYTCCGTLVTLKLKNTVLVDITSSFSFPTLKNLILVYVKYPGDELIKMLLSSCPVLEYLVVKRCLTENVTIFTVRVSSLKCLEIASMSLVPRYVIDAPFLESLNIADSLGDRFVIENCMTKIVEAHDTYPVGSTFDCLERLFLCTCGTEWLDLLICVLRDSSKLQAPKLVQDHHIRFHEPRPRWSEPSEVPECLLMSLETLEWVRYEGTEEEKVVAFILRSGSCLKKVTISSKSTDRDKKFEMLKVLALLFRCSPTCQLAFD